MKTKTTKTSLKSLFAARTLPNILGRTGRIFAVLALSILITGGSLIQNASADQFDEQIRALQGANAEAQNNVNTLQSQANSYQDAIYKLQVQINAITAQIAANQVEQTRLQAEIAAKQAEIDQQRALLGEGIKAMYVDGQISTIEMLATSNNLSDFVDKEEYRNAVQKNIQDSLTRIAKLQSELKQKEAQVAQLLNEQLAQEAQLAADRRQQADMLAYTEAQKNQFNAQISSNTTRIGELRRQQAIANARYSIGAPGAGANCGGGYPGSTPGPWGANWGCNHGLDNTVDNWGMFNRQCVSYTAFKVHADFLAGRNNNDMPKWGMYMSANAKDWDDNARNSGIPVDYNPTPGAIAVSNDGTYGHVMYVESVGTMNGQSAIFVSDYNQQWDGRYREYWRYTTGLVFVHF